MVPAIAMVDYPMTKSARVFLLSPANCTGERARQVMAESAAFPLAERLRSAEGVPLGEGFAFVSGLYFRGKLTYALAFARPPARRFACGVFVITPDREAAAPAWGASTAVPDGSSRLC